MERGQPLASKINLDHDDFATWHAGVQYVLVQAFGDDTTVVKNWQSLVHYYGVAGLYRPPGTVEENRRLAMAKSMRALESNIALLEAQIESETPLLPPAPGHMIFIGHGRSSAWRDLRDFLMNRLDLPVDEINRVAIAGATTVERLQEMLDGARFAFLVMTAEDEDGEGKLRARQNVIHEVGLFQGRLGFKKAIVLLEHGCEEFSNITGLSQIRFDKDNIAAKFEEIRRVLEREGLIPGTGAAF